MKKLLLGVLVLAVAYGGALAYVASRLQSASAARAEQDAQIAALGEKVAAEVRALDPGTSLKDACAGKLTAGGARSIVEYVPKVPEGSQTLADGVIWGLTDTGTDTLEMTPMNPPRTPYGWDVHFSRSMSPDDWPRLLEDASEERALYAQLRYVLVAHFSELAPARISGNTFDSGSARYRARVLSFPDGKTVCEGAGVGHFEQKEIVGHGGDSDAAREESERKLASAWHEATSASPLHDLCETGGKTLCFATNLEIDAPDW